MHEPTMPAGNLGAQDGTSPSVQHQVVPRRWSDQSDQHWLAHVHEKRANKIHTGAAPTDFGTFSCR